MGSVTLAVTFSWLFDPAQIAAGVAVNDVIAGIGLTVTATVALAEVQPLAVAVNVYVPEFADVVLGICGFCTVLVKPFGPLHEKVVPRSLVPFSCNALPTQPGPAEALAVGTGNTATFFVAVACPPHASVIKTLQTPAMAALWVWLVPAAIAFGFVQAYVYGPPPPVGLAVNTTGDVPQTDATAGVMFA